MAKPRIICWFSRGVASAIATKLELARSPRAQIVCCETGSEHPDNVRFAAECSKWFGKPIKYIRSDSYENTWDVWEKRRYLSGVDGALCTIEMKVIPRLKFQRPDDVHVFGYTFDKLDVNRAERLKANYPELVIRTPLIERKLVKASCLAMIKSAGIQLPPMYAMGFHTNNCIPCVKATSASYWALIRKKFPAKFARMARLSRELNVRLCRIKGERAFIDEIHHDHPTVDPIQPSCDFLCHIAEEDL
jgi:hypothetical protein